MEIFYIFLLSLKNQIYELITLLLKGKINFGEVTAEQLHTRLSIDSAQRWSLGMGSSLSSCLNI